MCFTWCEKTPAFATSVGMATIAEFTVGFPGCKGRIPFEAALCPRCRLRCWPNGAGTPTASANGGVQSHIDQGGSAGPDIREHPQS